MSREWARGRRVGPAAEGVGAVESCSSGVLVHRRASGRGRLDAVWLDAERVMDEFEALTEAYRRIAEVDDLLRELELRLLLDPSRPELDAALVDLVWLARSCAEIVMDDLGVQRGSGQAGDLCLCQRVIRAWEAAVLIPADCHQSWGSVLTCLAPCVDLVGGLDLEGRCSDASCRYEGERA